MVTSASDSDRMCTNIVDNMVPSIKDIMSSFLFPTCLCTNMATVPDNKQTTNKIAEAISFVNDICLWREVELKRGGEVLFLWLLADDCLPDHPPRSL